MLKIDAFLSPGGPGPCRLRRARRPFLFAGSWKCLARWEACGRSLVVRVCPCLVLFCPAVGSSSSQAMGNMAGGPRAFMRGHPMAPSRPDQPIIGGERKNRSQYSTSHVVHNLSSAGWHATMFGSLSAMAEKPVVDRQDMGTLSN